ncbi:MAG: hypothetical protein ACP5UL_05175 [Thermoplasmata archaeon]
MSESCKWLHESLESLPLIMFPFKLEQLPDNGIYFFYEDGEIWGHGENKMKIVRIGTHKQGNFKSRISEHFLLNESLMNFSKDNRKPSDRSIFRKNIGRALFNKDKDDYLQVWDIDFTEKDNRELCGSRRDIEKEKKIEEAITKIIREKFSFRFIILSSESERMGKDGIEKHLIGTVANCELCKPSPSWLGNYSPKYKIRESGLWLEHHIKANPISEKEKEIILKAIKETKDWLKSTSLY